MRAEVDEDHAAARVEHDVERRVEPAHRRDLVDVGAHRAGVGAVVRRRRRDEVAVVRLDRLVGDDARQDQLAAAARAPVVRLRLPDRDLHVAPRDFLVQPDRRAARGDADVRVGLGVPRLVLEERDPEPLHARRGWPSRASSRCRTPTSGRPCRSRRSRLRLWCRPPRARRTRPAAASTAAWAGTGCRSRSRPTCRRRAARRTAGPATGDSSAAAAAAVASGQEVGLVRVDRGEQVRRRRPRARAHPDRPSTRRRPLRSSAGRETRTGS